jgi:hypothetical protein
MQAAINQRSQQLGWTGEQRTCLLLEVSEQPEAVLTPTFCWWNPVMPEMLTSHKHESTLQLEQSVISSAAYRALLLMPFD